MHGKPLLPQYNPPGGRVADPSLVQDLRAIDPHAELLYLGRGFWILGVVTWNRVAVRSAIRRLDRLYGALHTSQQRFRNDPELLLEWASRILSTTLASWGFRPVATYQVEGWPDSAITKDFRIRDWKYRHLTESAAEAEFMENTSHDNALEKRQKRIVEAHELTHRDVHRYAFRGQHSVTSRRAAPRPSTRTLVRSI